MTGTGRRSKIILHATFPKAYLINGQIDEQRSTYRVRHESGNEQRSKINLQPTQTDQFPLIVPAAENDEENEENDEYNYDYQQPDPPFHSDSESID